MTVWFTAGSSASVVASSSPSPPSSLPDGSVVFARLGLAVGNSVLHCFDDVGCKSRGRCAEGGASLSLAIWLLSSASTLAACANWSQTSSETAPLGSVLYSSQMADRVELATKTGGHSIPSLSLGTSQPALYRSGRALLCWGVETGVDVVARWNRFS